MSSSNAAEIHVGDIGTVYRVPCYDDDLTPANFDPSAATTKQLIFKMPGTAALITRAATAAQVTIDGASVWCLTYTVTAADVAAWASDTVGGFHQEAGTVKIEGYLEFSSSQKWASGTVTKDQQGRTLRVVARLAA
jgi:hypothetical protein